MRVCDTSSLASSAVGHPRQSQQSGEASPMQCVASRPASASNKALQGRRARRYARSTRALTAHRARRHQQASADARSGKEEDCIIASEYLAESATAAPPRPLPVVAITQAGLTSPSSSMSANRGIAGHVRIRASVAALTKPRRVESRRRSTSAEQTQVHQTDASTAAACRVVRCKSETWPLLRCHAAATAERTRKTCAHYARQAQHQAMRGCVAAECSRQCTAGDDDARQRSAWTRHAAATADDQRRGAQAHAAGRTPARSRSPERCSM